jgi:hypothetical protein
MATPGKEGMREVRAQIDEHGSVYVAEEDLEKSLQEAEKKVGARLARGLLDNTQKVEIKGISFRYVGSNKEWQE